LNQHRICKKPAVFLSCAALVCLCLLSLSARASAAAGGACGAGLTWTLDSSGLLSISGSGAMTDYKIGGAPWYADHSNIKSVKIGSGVTSIGNNAFYDCTCLNAVNYVFPSTLEKIGSYAFHGCAFDEFCLPESIRTIASPAFDDCQQLTAVYLHGNPKLYFDAKSWFSFYYPISSVPDGFHFYVTSEYNTAQYPHMTYDDNVEHVAVMNHADHSGRDGCCIDIPYAAPTCQTAGINACEICRYCGAYFNSDHPNDLKTVSAFSIPKVGHTANENEISWTWSSDNSSASAAVTCKTCGYQETFSASVVTTGTPATCTASGSQTRTATMTYGSAWSYSGRTQTNKKTETLPATGHTAVEIPAVPYTDTAVGWTAGEKCSVCGEILKAPEKVLIPVAAGVYKAALARSAGDSGTGSYFYASEFLSRSADFPNAKIVSMVTKGSGQEMSVAKDSTSGMFSSIGLVTGTGEIFCLPKKACQTGTEEYTVSIQLDEIHEAIRSELSLDTHAWEADYTVDRAPTETQTGEKSIHCSKCSARKDVQTIPMIVTPPTVRLQLDGNSFSYSVAPGTYRGASFFLLAEYGADGRMLAVHEVSLDLSGAGACTGEIPAANLGAVYRAFLLDALHAPLARAVSPAS
jgi:hypothetical protein